MGRILFLILFAGVGVFYYYFFGPAPGPSEIGDLAWWRPRGWATRWSFTSGLRDLAREPGAIHWLPVGLACLPPLLLLIGGFRIFRNRPLRALFLATSLTLCAFAAYGYLSVGIWKFFSWRWAAVTASTAGVLAGAAMAPALFEASRRVSPVARGAILLATLAGVYLLSTEITGTNPELFGNISPWPVLTFFGLLFCGYTFAALHAAAGVGVWLRSRLENSARAFAGAGSAAIVAAALSFAVFEDPWPVISLGLAAGAAAYAWRAGRRRSAQSAREFALAQLGAAAVIAVSIGLGDWRAAATQAEIRDEKAARVITALDDFKNQFDTYPDKLQELVPTHLSEVPAPRIGVFEHDHEVFIYSNYGDSYALEFASVLWDQCQYSPPYVDDYDYDEEDEEDMEDEDTDDAAGETDDSLQGSWTCGSAPPKLW